MYGQSYDRRNVFGYSDSDVKVSSIYLECLRNKTIFFCPTSNFKKSVYLDDPFSYAFLVQFCVEGILFVLLTLPIMFFKVMRALLAIVIR